MIRVHVNLSIYLDFSICFYCAHLNAHIFQKEMPTLSPLVYRDLQTDC